MKLRRLISSQSGATMAEYALIISVIAGGLIVAVAGVSAALESRFVNTADHIAD